MKKVIAVMALASMATVGACSMLGRQAFVDPIVHLRNVKVRSLGLSGGNLDVVLSVYNPNGFRLDATRLTYNLFVGDSVNLAAGALDTQTTVQASDSTLVTVPVSFTYSGLSSAANQILQTGAVNYRVTGDVTVGTVVGNFTRPYSATGRFDTMH
jgi:LEA14-like dessication related protein